jgi:agmatinase
MTNPNPAFGAEQQPFMGIPSFMRLPVSRDLGHVDVAILGIPFDSGTTYRSGTRFGPRKIREASLMLWGYNAALLVKPTEKLNMVDCGDAPIVPTSIERTMEIIQNFASEIIQKNVTLISLGGDHSIALPLLRAHAEKYGPLGVVHIDAHLDTWESEFEGRPYSHGTPFRRALEEGLIRKGEYVQVGIRGPVDGARDYQEAKDLGAVTITADFVHEHGIAAVLQEVRRRIKGSIYLTLDIDSADPAFAPGTGTPEVGGLTSHQLLQLIRGLNGLDIIGFDLVEVSPPYDHQDITAILAANLVFEVLSLLALRK